MGRVVSQAELERILGDHPAVQAGCLQAAETVAAEAQLIGASDAYATGAYVAGIRAELRPGGGAAAVANAPHSAPLEGGTGIFGPLRRMIRAKPGRKMVFKTRLPPRGDQTQAKVLGGVERTVAITEHRGIPARHIMERAARIVAARSSALRFRSKPWEPRG